MLHTKIRPSSQSKNYASQNLKVEPTEKSFEYIGTANLTIRGNATGRSYHFRYTGHRLKVDHMDSYAMRAEADLRIL